MNKPLIIVFALILTLPATFAQNRSASYLTYIEKYSSLAVEQQKRYRIPASITLAQGLLESGAGRSELSLSSNNHFGIKCHNTWEGEKVYHRDDHADPECFRKYNEVRDSYEDHSLFLTKRNHYSFLFDLNPTDYKGWAYGLKKAGYATDPAYPVKLIKIIDDYELHRFDLEDKSEYLASKTDYPKKRHSPIITNSSTTLYQHELFRNNKVKCIFSLPGDTYAGIAQEFNLSLNKLLQYNDLAQTQELEPGTIIYIKEKKKKAARGYLQHVVKDGENMYRISQKYAIKLDKLYDLNKMSYSTGAEVGMKLKLR